MKKKLSFNLSFVLALIAAFCFAVGIIGLNGDKAYADEIAKPQPTTFEMRDGASIYYGDPSGIRFTTYVDPAYYEELANSGKTFRFGTIYAPATAYSGTIEEFTHASTVTGGVSDVKVGAGHWQTDTVNEKEYKIYRTVQLFSERARDNGYYGVKMFARSYVYVDENDDGNEDAGEYTYVDGVVRSIAEVASKALASGETNEYIESIPQKALASGKVLLNGYDYHKDGKNSFDASRDNQDHIYLLEGETCDLVYTPVLLHQGSYMTDAEDYEVAYSSSNEGVFTVDGGSIIAVGAGEASLTAGIVAGLTAPDTTIGVVTPDSTVYDQSGVSFAFDFDDVSYYGDTNALVLDEDYISEKISEGYTSVEVTLAIAENGGSGISARFIIGDTENVIASGEKSLTTVSGKYSLTSGKAYSVIFRQSVRETLDIGITLRFTKPVKAYTSTNGVYTNYGEENTTLTASATTVSANSETTTYTLEVVDHKYTFVNFSSELINKKIAQGYTRASFAIAPYAGYKNVILSGTGISNNEINIGTNGYVDYDPIDLTDDGEYRIRLYLAATNNITVTVTFIKNADLIAYSVRNGAEYGVTSSSAGNAQGELVTYTLANVVNSISSYFELSSSIINAKIAQGYQYVTFSFAQSGYKQVALYRKGELLQSPAAENAGITLNTISLTAGDNYRITITHNINSNNPANIAVTAQFIKPVKAFTSSNGVFSNYVDEATVSASIPTTDLYSQVITYTINVKDHDYTFLNFNAQFINAKIAQGYTNVALTVGPNSGYKATYLEGTGITTVTKDTGNGGVSYDAIPLTENGSYDLRLYLAETTDITVTAKFYKSVRAFLRSDETEIAFTSAVSTTTLENDTITYTLANLAKGTDYRIYFYPSLFEEKIAEGYDQVTFTISGNWGWKDCYLDGTRSYSNGSVSYAAISIDAISTHWIQVNESISDDPQTLTIKAVFTKSA